jgi:methionine sulfoxide reductase heme-binding subunit
MTTRSLDRTLGTTGSWRRRLLFHHVPLAAVSAVLFVVFMAMMPDGPPPQMDVTDPSVLPREAATMDHGGDQASGFGRSFMTRATTATGYVATVLLGGTLLIGPANLMLRRRNPVSSYLRRDAGTWTAVVSIIHVVAGFQVHGSPTEVGNFLRYFVASDGAPRTNSFGLANWTGLAALVIVAGLLALSTDRSLRELKATRWKNLQRLNYALFALVGLHAFFYGALLRVTSPFTLVLIVTVIAVFAGQTVGIWLWRRKHRRSTSAES